MADSEPVASMVLDRLLPSFQAAERHSATIFGSADQVWAALTPVTTGELRLLCLLMGMMASLAWSSLTRYSDMPH